MTANSIRIEIIDLGARVLALHEWKSYVINHGMNVDEMVFVNHKIELAEAQREIWKKALESQCPQQHCVEEEQ